MDLDEEDTVESTILLQPVPAKAPASDISLALDSFYASLDSDDASSSAVASAAASPVAHFDEASNSPKPHGCDDEEWERKRKKVRKKVFLCVHHFEL